MTIGAAVNGQEYILVPVGTCSFEAVATCPGTTPGDIMALTLIQHRTAIVPAHPHQHTLPAHLQRRSQRPDTSVITPASQRLRPQQPLSVVDDRTSQHDTAQAVSSTSTVWSRGSRRDLHHRNGLSCHERQEARLLSFRREHNTNNRMIVGYPANRQEARLLVFHDAARRSAL